MARPIYSHEVLDADFQWLMNHYCERHPSAFVIDHACLPVVIILGTPRDKFISEGTSPTAPTPQVPALANGAVSEDQDQ